ncbi:phosphatase 2C-like domain-containing protein, partial [Tribonema minus]
RVSSHTITGPRHAGNEDAILIEADVFSGCDACDRLVGLFGVFDGHGGASCSAMAKRIFPLHFRESQTWESLRGAVPGDATAVERVLVAALEDAFAKTCRQFEAFAEAHGDNSGACALVVAVCDGVVVTANVGDSKAIMYTRDGDKQSVRSTARHNISNPDEVARVLASGGHFVQNRLLGCLLPTRALGNIDCLKLCPGVLSARPQFQVVRLRPLAPPSDAAALVLASDGLWDFVETPQVVAALKAGLKRQARHLATVDVAGDLVADAVRAGSNDDTSVVVLVMK